VFENGGEDVEAVGLTGMLEGHLGRADPHAMGNLDLHEVALDSHPVHHELLRVPLKT